MIQVIQLRWNNFFNLLINSEDDFRSKLLSEINKYTKFDEEKRSQLLELKDEKTVDTKEAFDAKLRKILSNYKNDLELWKVLGKNFDSLNNIKDWTIYRRVTEVSKESTVIQKRLKVFIAYSRRDGADIANHVYKYLNKFIHDVFTDVASIKIGDIWSSSIEKNISDCDFFVVIVTYAALQSSQVERELVQAQKEMKIIIPCFYKKCDR